MNDQPQLFNLRRDELDALISDHLGAGSLDEGNGAAFDRLVDAWLDQELAAIERAFAQHAREVEETVRRQETAQARARQKRQDADSRAQDRRQARDERRDASRQRRVGIAQARTARRDHRLGQLEQRLREAQARLQHAERRLVGELVVAPPIVSGSASPTAERHVDERVA
jgi:hypothetical protein